MKNWIGLWFQLSRMIPPERAEEAMKIIEAYPAIPETKHQPVIPSDGASKTEGDAVTEDANDPSAFDVAGDQLVKNQPATAKLRAQVRMGHRE